MSAAVDWYRQRDYPDIYESEVLDRLRHATAKKSAVSDGVSNVIDATNRFRPAVTPTGAIQPEIAPVFLPLLADARYKGAEGGRGSGKSHTFASMMVMKAVSQPGLRAVCLREVQKSLRYSAKLLIEDKIARYRLGSYFDIKEKFIRTPGHGIIIFQGMQGQTSESIKSLEGFDIGWGEEAHRLSQRSIDLIRPTFREEGSELWFSWNPESPKDPVEQLFNEQPPGSVRVKANYYDNPWFPEVLRREMEWDRRRDPDKYQHIWLGGYQARSEARVFHNWRIEEFDTPANAQFLFGADWGYSNDPTVLVRMFLMPHPTDKKARGTLYIDREVWKIGCAIDKTPQLFDALDPDALQMARGQVVTADSARPETIDYMKRHGYPRMVPSHKGAGSVYEGVEFLKSYDIVVHPRCIHVIDELMNYRYKVDEHTNEVLNILLDKKNHTIDSIRYAIEKMRRFKTAGTF